MEKDKLMCHSPMDFYTWRHQCWPTSKNLHPLALLKVVAAELVLVYKSSTISFQLAIKLAIYKMYIKNSVKFY